MPRGTYLHLSDRIEERFQCAPGAGGWRYVGERTDGRRVDLTVDSRWRQIRVELTTPHWLIRGGVSGNNVLWLRSGETAEEHSAQSIGFLGDSPAFLVAVARHLSLAPGARADVRLVRITGPSLAALTITQRWRLTELTTHETDTEPLPVAHYEVTDLATGESEPVHIAGDVVLAAPDIELDTLDTPPTL